MGALTVIFENEMMVSHKIVAENTGNDEVAVKNLLHKHKADFEAFGTVHFKNERVINDGRGSQPVTYYFNEQQATLLLTYLRNNEVVRRFKVQLVKEFYEMREKLYQNQDSELQDIIMAQNATIADQQRRLQALNGENAPKHPKSGLKAADHNRLLELIYQFSAHKQDLRTRIKADLDSERRIGSFLASIAKRYPELNAYIEQHSEQMEHLLLTYSGATPDWDKIEKLAEGI